MASIATIIAKVLNLNNNINSLNEFEFKNLLDSLYNSDINSIKCTPNSIKGRKLEMFCEHDFVKNNIKNLYLSENSLTDEDMKFVSKLHNLRYLDLSNNLITRDCVIHTMVCMFNNRSILDLKNNALNHTQILEIRDIVQVTGLSEDVFVLL